MASIISAGTTAGTALNMTGDTTGNLAFQTSNGTYTQTLPNATGTVMVSGNMPAFSAWQNVAQTLATTTYTKITCDTEEFDTNSCYDNTTNYRFTPTVAGYYQMNAGISAGGTQILPIIYKNGSAYKRGNFVSANQSEATVSCLVYCNGSTDYIEFYAYFTTGATTNNNSFQTYFQGAMVRSA